MDFISLFKFTTFQNSSSSTPQWNDFYKEAVKYFKGELSGYVSDLTMNKGHFYFSGFLTNRKGKIFYFCSLDVRGQKRMYIRTATDYKDYTGGSNNMLDIDHDLPEEIIRIIK